MISRQELAEAILKNDKLKLGLIEKFYDREYQCAYCGDKGQVIFDQDNQELDRYENDYCVAALPIESVKQAITALEAYVDTGELPDEEYV